jgi:cysteine desulfurase
VPPALPIYLDNHATTPVDPRVVEAMLPYFTEKFGNAGSINHSFGIEALAAVDLARDKIAAAIGACSQPREIVFTSGATESNNLALRGLADRARRKGNHIVSVATEHKAVLDPLKRLSRRGFDVTLLDVEPHASNTAGWLDPQKVADAIRNDTLLVSVMLANNEIGVIQPIAEIADICHQHAVPLHCDATQAVGKIPVDVNALGVDLMSFSAHKIYGPKGIGGLYVRRSATTSHDIGTMRLEPQIDGGGQENGLRSGTLNVPGVVGFARALELCLAEMPSETQRLAKLRQQLWDGLNREISDAILNGPAFSSMLPTDYRLLPTPSFFRLPGNLNCSFPLVNGEALMISMKNVALSSGSACTSANPEPSHVLRALGLSDDLTRASLRFGIGRFNTAEEIDYTITAVAENVQRLRKLSSLASY